ncbi:TorF family putative porin [Sphingobium sp. HBC34]|uniref:TorF family putative porin n=1 Tax=Sphingobium cyanobacteriorum TaxID=3063954 RepID=A0ABT8ZIE9_9SPHN|nr:TorF family putative porin [Sphingobium sp. HBC34]MDO7833799.1 TorF family putative porin [Sphingobium sp. HBC34]
MRPTDIGCRLAWLGATLLAGHVLPAAAQYASGPSILIEAASDERRRGLSWSDGDPVLRAAVSLPVADGFSLDGAVATLRGSGRHGGADAVLDLGISYVKQIGGVRLTADTRYHLFPGACAQGYSTQDYGEIGAGAEFLIGPASFDLSASYAPRQSAIGGDNLYLATAATAAIPGTPLTLSARIGRSSGHVRDPARAARLRPDGAYWDHGAGMDYIKGRWSAGLHYANSSIDGPGRRHAGARLIGRVGLTL